ncbi:hypothetical protein QJS10_CPA01g00016 [Acorus calamus]|uniref:SMP-LTD domain-containing protein n=1 Tax=Acorus calamus TaxID=4465 RepID=A0AAV9FU16_ACOCL|nr:hypothetical protein QJS10_CPA01g00016 [Acorus calamus]
MISLFVGIVLGAVTVVLAECLILITIVRRLQRKSSESSTGKDDGLQHQHRNGDLDFEQSIAFACNKEGFIWVLEPEMVPKVTLNESPAEVPKGQKNKKEIVEVSPIKKYANIKDHSLILKDIDGSQAIVQLAGCTILSVSSSSLSSKKWAKKYPIKVECKNSAVYKESRTLYLYLETSWDKESWCKALRLASSEDKQKLNWYWKLREEFHHYFASLNAEYLKFLKPSTGLAEVKDKIDNLDGSSSKVRLFLKKLAKKASKAGAEYKAMGHGEKKVGDKVRASQETSSKGSSAKISSADTSRTSSLQDAVVPPSASSSVHSNSYTQGSVLLDADSYEKFGADEGTLCWNLLFSRLFFDAKRNSEISSFIKSRIQRTLSDMRTPNYIAGVTCTGIDLGSLPPYIYNMRVLPMDMNEVWAVEVDFEYSGGAILDIETRLEVREPEFQKGIVDTGLESSSIDEATSGLLEGFEHYGAQLDSSIGTVEKTEKKDEGDLGDLKHSKSTSWTSAYVSRWKNILNSLANQVSQVPISLAINIASLRGTIRFHIKPPPSDQVWFGFTLMPEINWNFESSIGDRKITNAHVAMIIGSRFKAAIRETLVLPNCESICLPWMLSEKDDWVPRNVAPFIWVRINQDSSDPMGRDTSSKQTVQSKTKLDASSSIENSPTNSQDNSHEKIKNAISPQPPAQAQLPLQTSSSQHGPSTLGLTDTLTKSKSMEDLTVPLLSEKQDSGSQRKVVRNDDQDISGRSELESSGEIYPSRAIVVAAEESVAEEDAKPKRIGGRRAKMMDLGKKMSEKLEEKRRNIEEKGRNIVEKMRGGHDT